LLNPNPSCTKILESPIRKKGGLSGTEDDRTTGLLVNEIKRFWFGGGEIKNTIKEKTWGEGWVGHGGMTEERDGHIQRQKEAVNVAKTFQILKGWIRARSKHR